MALALSDDDWLRSQLEQQRWEQQASGRAAQRLAQDVWQPLTFDRPPKPLDLFPKQQSNSNSELKMEVYYW